LFESVVGLLQDSPENLKILEEIIPEVRKEHNVTDDPNRRAIGGVSSGAICAWTVAWEHPDSFRKVLSIVGSFADIRGGHNYSSLICKTPESDTCFPAKRRKRFGPGVWELAAG